MNQQIIQKYSTPVPRYTSYPPANFFQEITREEHLRLIENSNKQAPKHLSFYIHIPFCVQLCHYCGCNAWKMPNQQHANTYIKALKKEIKQTLPLLSKERKIAQIHYGGGTPTSIEAKHIAEINNLLLSSFDTIENPEIAIECHSGYMDENYWDELLKSGFNRISLGVQDFDSEVLKASNRKPSLLPMHAIMDIIGEYGASVNFDFIYGLPLQTAESFSQTIRKAVALKPNRLVTFSYAHVPWVNPSMKILEKRGLPSASEKTKMFEYAQQILTQESEYRQLGLDHFVLPDDELFRAKQQKLLKRNFQGYCTARTTGQVYAFGVTGISQLATAYVQNIKNIKEYIDCISQGNLPTSKGYVLSKSELIIKEVIEQLMCNYEVNWSHVAQSLNITTEEVLANINYNPSQLRELEKDGLISLSDTQISVNPNASIFARNIAATLDPLLQRVNKQRLFSKSV